jgi:Zn ribbon nucleic-acid-binding protein
MTERKQDDLWRDFPKTATEFEARFATEEDCRGYWIEARWGGQPACARCNSTRVWSERGGFLFECAECGHQTSLTSGTLLEKTRKPVKVWFRAVFEISTRRTGISAKDLQRILGFGSYRTAWTWLHKLRAAMVRSDSESLGPFVQIDEALVGGKGGPHKELVLVAAEAGGRVRQTFAGLSRRVRVPPQPPQDQGRGADRGPRHRAIGRPRAIADAKDHQGNKALPLVRP